MANSQLPLGVSVVVPVYRGAPTLRELNDRLTSVLASRDLAFEVIFVDDGSPDESWKIITDLAASHDAVHGLRLGRNYGQHAALLAGIRKARYSIAVTLDDDLQNPPEEIPRLLGELVEGVDVVYGTPRVVREDLWRRQAARLARWSIKASGVAHAPSVSSFRAFRTDLRQAFDVSVGPAVAIDSLLAWGTTRFVSIDVQHNERKVAASNYTARQLLTFALDLFTGFTAIPLRIATLLGLVTSAFGAVLLLWVLVRYFVEGDRIVGFPFLASTIIIFSGVQLLILGLIGEYLGRMHFRTMGKPSYAILSSTDRSE
jgi:undecaprenyl-phosphate 4-deoxy-4-formamido-L-arabinose transferase